jgi:hypothetical protein
MIKFKTKHKYALTLGIALIIVALIDFLNIDSFLYYNLCSFIYGLGAKSLVCATFYDLPFWQTELVAGFLLTGYFAFHFLEVHFSKQK